jgi:hypothetical protein
MTTQLPPLLCPTSAGDVIDRITILQIKSERITDEGKLVFIDRELTLLSNLCDAHGIDLEMNLVTELKAVNEKLWDIEDAIRLKERAKEFDEEFIQLARSVYLTNDQRATLKASLNMHHRSLLQEVKSYSRY